MATDDEGQPTGVQSLTYSFAAESEFEHYTEAPAWEGRCGEFDLRLADGQLVATPTARCDDVETARAALEPFLRAWEFKADVEDGMPIVFRFQSGAVHEVRVGHNELRFASEVSMTTDAVISVDRRSYPSPPTMRLGDTPLVREVRGFVRDVRHRRQRLLAAAYLMLTRLEFEYGGRDAAAHALRVSSRVLTTLGRLAATNDPDERRKVKGPVVRLTEQERAWVVAAMSRVAFYAAAAEADEVLGELTMADLPAL